MLQDPMPPCTWIYASLEADTKLSSGMQLWWKYPNQPEEMFCLCAVRAGYGEAAVDTGPEGGVRHTAGVTLAARRHVAPGKVASVKGGRYHERRELSIAVHVFKSCTGGVLCFFRSLPYLTSTNCLEF